MNKVDKRTEVGICRNKAVTTHQQSCVLLSGCAFRAYPASFAHPYEGPSSVSLEQYSETDPKHHSNQTKNSENKDKNNNGSVKKK